jgi:gliding motility-associatede transport system auxiliary component
MRELALVGLVAVLFGLGSYWATDHFGVFSAVNLLAGGCALLVALGLGARRLRALGGPHSRPVIARGLLGIAAALAVAVAAERLAERLDWRFDWTLEGEFVPSEAVCRAVADLPGPLSLRLFSDPLDPRRRRTRLRLEALARCGPVQVSALELGSHPELEDRFGVPSSNSVVVELGGRWELLPRPTEGALYEALYHLRDVDAGSVALLAGAGEGDPQRGDEFGYSGLGVALQTEGYRVRSLVSAALREVPPDVKAVIAIAPRRHLTAEGLGAIRRYLERGGALVALLEPGLDSGLEALLADYGFDSPQQVLVDPASAALDDDADGVGILAFNYETHPVTRGLDSNRMTFFPGARGFVLRKPEPGDELRRLVLTSPRAWPSPDLGLLERRQSLPEPPAGALRDYQTVVAAGRYLRNGVETRIVVFGDADFASNRNLRTLYNLDLILNAVHWATQRESDIVLRPKIRNAVQFPLPVENTLQAFYGVGLLVPELLLLIGAVVWLRGRSA